MQNQKAKEKQIPTSSTAYTRSQDPDITYRRTRDGFITALKLVKATSEATSFLSPLKAACEISLLFLDTTKNINENTKGLRQLKDNLSGHIATLDEGYAWATEARGDQVPDALDHFAHKLKDYIAGLKGILTRMDEQMRDREKKGYKGFLRKLSDTTIDTESIADYKQDITHQTLIFEEATRACHMELQTEVWTMARLGPEKPRPMGNQHKRCQPGTRVPILREIHRWSLDPNAQTRIFWLCDESGTGKSTVAFTMCEEWDNTPNFVFGRFFFSKNARATSETDAFCSVVAEDIGSKDEEIMQKVQSAKQKDTQLLERGLRFQFTKLMEEPLKLANNEIILVIDAIDECKKRERGELLRLLLELLSSMSNLKLLITSRPERDITAILQGRAIVRGMKFDMNGKEERTNLEDITSYVDAHLAKLLTAAERHQLIERSNGLFIWITTASLELQQVQGSDAVDTTLKSLLTRGKGGDTNQVYAGVLHRLIREQSLDVIRRVMGTILILFEPVSTEVLAKLTNIAQPELERILGSMQSIFSIDNVVEFLHLTFREYLVSAHSEMSFDSTTARTDLAVSILNILQEDLKEDICGIIRPDQPCPKIVDLPDLDERLQRVWNNSPALPYSVRYWSYHIVPAVTNEAVAKALQIFLETRILNLIELVGLMGQMNLFRTLEEVRRGLGYQQSNTLEAELCRDAVRLVQRYQTILEESPIHIYSSALLFLPRKTRLWATYGTPNLTSGLPNIVGPPSEHWPSHQILVGHGSPITCVAISPDGIRMASGSDDKTLRIWDVTTGASVGELKGGHIKAVTCLAFSPDGLQIASGSWDGALRLWDAKAGTPMGVNTQGHTKAVTCLAFSPDGLCVASGSDDKTLRLWDARTGASTTELTGHTGVVTCLTFLPDGLCIASGSEDYTIRLWDMATGASIGEFKGHTGIVTCLACLPDGPRIVSGSGDSTLRVWDVTTGTAIQMLEGHTDVVTCLALSPDGFRIASGSRDTTLRLWDITAGAIIAELRGHTGVVTCLTLSPDGLRIASGSRDATLRLWDATTGASIEALKGHTSGVTCLAFSSDGLHAASGSYDKTLRLWDMTSGSRIAVLEGDTSRIACLAFSPDGLLIASESSGGTLRLWDAATASSLGTPHTLPNRVYTGYNLRFAEDGKSIQVNKRTTFDVSQHRFLLTSPTRNVVYSNSLQSNVYEQNKELWCASYPHRRYKVPQEIKWSTLAKHQDKVAFGLNDGQIMVIDFREVHGGP